MYTQNHIHRVKSYNTSRNKETFAIRSMNRGKSLREECKSFCL